jgi:hypothetical protein
MTFYIQVKIRLVRDGAPEEVAWNFWTDAENKEAAIRAQRASATNTALMLRAFQKIR